MILPDVNVLVAAYREDHVHYSVARSFLKDQHDTGELLALCDISLSGFLRIVSNPRIFPIPTTLDRAFDFVNKLTALPAVVRIAPGPDHWKIFEELCRKSKATGGLVTDAYLAALALEHGCRVATFDADFKRFPGLRTVRPK